MRRYPILAAAILAATLTGVGCGCHPDPGHTYCLDLETTQPWASEPDAAERVFEIVGMSLDRWDTHLHSLHDWRIVFKDGDISCGPGIAVDAQGCTDWLSKTITIRATECLEHSSLPHEIGHVAYAPFYDPAHWNKGWWDADKWNALADKLVAMKRTDFCKSQTEDAAVFEP